MLCSTDPSTKMDREERMHIVPILCKYIGRKDNDNEVIDKLQASLVDDLVYCRV